MSTPLDGERYINLETFRKDDSGVKTPVWAAPLDGKLVIVTDGRSWKVKRIRANPKVRVAACNMRGDVRGPWHEGSCRLLDEAVHAERAQAALRARYGWQLWFFQTMAKLRRRASDRVYLEVTVAA